MKVVRLSAQRSSRLNPPENIVGSHFCQGLRRPKGHTAAGRVTPMKSSNYTIGKRTLDPCQSLSLCGFGTETVRRFGVGGMILRGATRTAWSDIGPGATLSTTNPK